MKKLTREEIQLATSSMSDEEYKKLTEISSKQTETRSAFMNRIITTDLALCTLEIAISPLVMHEEQLRQGSKLFLLTTLLLLLLSAACLLIADYQRTPATHAQALYEYMKAALDRRRDPEKRRLPLQVQVHAQPWVPYVEILGYFLFGTALLFFAVFSFLLVLG